MPINFFFNEISARFTRFIVSFPVFVHLLLLCKHSFSLWFSVLDFFNEMLNVLTLCFGEWSSSCSYGYVEIFWWYTHLKTVNSIDMNGQPLMAH